MKKTYFEAYNPMMIGSKVVNEFNKNMFYETFAVSDQVVLVNDHILDIMELSPNSEKQVMRLLEKNDISIVLDFLPYNLIKHNDSDTIIELKIDSSVNRDEIFNDERFLKCDRASKRLIERKTSYLDYSDIDITEVCQYICNVMNDQELLSKLYEVGVPHRLINNTLPTMDYKVSIKNNVFYIDSEDEFKKSLKTVLVTDFLSTILRSYINMRSQKLTESDSLVVSNSNRAIFEKLYNDKLSTTTQKINTLLTVQNMPSLETYFMQKRLNLEDAIKIRKKLKNLRAFVNECEFEDDISFYKEYRDRLDNELKNFNDVKYKTIRLLLTSFILPFGIAYGVGDITGFNKKLIHKFSPTIKLEDIFSNESL